MSQLPRHLLIFLLCPVFSLQQDNIYFRDEVLDIGSPCRSPKGIGTCVLGSNCRDPFGGFFTNNRKSSICFFKDSKTPVICCPNDKLLQEDGVPSSTSWEDIFPPLPTLRPPKTTSKPESSPISDKMPDPFPDPVFVKLNLTLTPLTKPSPTPSTNTPAAVTAVPAQVSAPSSPALTTLSSIKCQEYSQNYTVGDGVEVEGIIYTAVVGGIPANLGEFPHMAVIGMPDPDGNSTKWFCGGSLISERYILTAAHCIIRTIPTVIRLGELDITRDNDGATPQDYGVETIISHPDYKGSSVYNDLALIRLDKNVEFNQFIRPACLAKEWTSSDSRVTAYGWGHTSFGGVESPVLMKIPLTVYATKECSDNYPASRRLRTGIMNTQICAGDPDGFRDTCQGDSGGPISMSEYIEDINASIFYILGVTSFGQGCGGVIPAIYTNVFSYSEWIEGIVWKA
uniref:Putative serine protease 18d n=1 Tax=Phlebotomus kandelakii TaxID=1109342 RepID=A0A6B2EGH1_9DIPT